MYKITYKFQLNEQGADIIRENQSHETISALRMCLRACDPKSPSDVIMGHEPNNHIKYAWIPQTLGESVWVMYDFKSKKDREDWENSLPETVSKFLDRDLIKYALEYGWSVRDPNGFVINTERAS